MTEQGIVFISYAREDQSWAERLYMDLRKHEIDAWIDVRCIAAGANWELEIKKAIRKSRYFILLLSKHSITKRGFIQKEMKAAIDVLQEFPKDHTFLIPARLDGTEPVEEELRALNWVELIPDYHSGFSRILSALTDARPAPLTFATRSATGPALSMDAIDKGREISIELPLLIGPRAAINYAPFRSKPEFLQQFFDRLPPSQMFTDRTLAYYITLDTTDDRVLIGDDLRSKYPEYITLVLQNAFRDLEVRREGISVILAFGGVERTIAFPYESVRRIDIPELGIAITLKP
jgi:TIR domain/Stringent starvation protein B